MNEIFSQKLFICLDKYSIFCDKLLIRDINYDMLSKSKFKTMTDLLELFDYKKLIKDATCFKKDCSPTLTDARIFTNASKSCIKTLNFITGISDCHNLISTVINSNFAKDEIQNLNKEVLWLSVMKIS